MIDFETVIVIDPGRQVICDICSGDWTDRPESGGILVLSKGVCPDCTPRMLESIKKYNEEWSIKGECPKDMSHADWIRDVVRKRAQ
jgi:hypothetical protein